jgi:cytochrome c
VLASAGEAAPAPVVAEQAPALASDPGAAIQVAATPAASADPALIAEGENQFRKCASCHKVGEGACNGTGAVLNGSAGEAAGRVEGFTYSKRLMDMASAGLVWDEASLDALLEDPKGFMKGTKMSFGGLKNPRSVPRSSPISRHLQIDRMVARPRLRAVAAACAKQAAADEIGAHVVGEDLSKTQCAFCHHVWPEAKNRIAPSLTGVFERRAGMADGSAFTSIVRMENDGPTRAPDTRGAHFKGSKPLVSGRSMNFRGPNSREDRMAVFARLRDFSDRPRDIPEAEPPAVKSAPQLPPEVLAIRGDVAFGACLSSACTTCHQRNGSDQVIPSITPWAKRIPSSPCKPARRGCARNRSCRSWQGGCRMSRRRRGRPISRRWNG